MADARAAVRPWLIAVAVAVLLAAAGLRLFVWPGVASAPPAPGAVIVLSGPSERLDLGLALMARGLATTLVVSNGAQHGWDRGNRLCEDPQPYDVVCFVPRPQSTAGEARAIGELMRSHGWEDVVVVTSPSHVTRARVLVEQCAEGVSVVSTARPLLERLRPSDLIRESFALGAAVTIARAC